MSDTIQAKRRRFTPGAIAAGLLGTLAIAVSLGASLSAYSAGINNTVNNVATNAISVTESLGATTCTSVSETATTCATINKYGGGTLSPGGSTTTTVTFTNNGSVAIGSSSLTPLACSSASTGVTGSTTPTTPNTSAGNLCSVVNVAVYKASTATGTPIYNGSAAGFTAPITNLGSIAVGASQDYTFVVSVPTGAGNAVQGQRISQQLNWGFAQ